MNRIVEIFIREGKKVGGVDGSALKNPSGLTSTIYIPRTYLQQRIKRENEEIPAQ